MKLTVSLIIDATTKNVLDLLQGPAGGLGNDIVDESNRQESTECVDLKISLNPSIIEHDLRSQSLVQDRLHP
jgi:hypothetical protein